MSFMIHFLICNVFLAFFVCLILIFRHIFRHYLSAQRKYQLWYLLLALLVVPFLPFHPVGFNDLLGWLMQQPSFSISPAQTTDQTTAAFLSDTAPSPINDFTVSVSRGFPERWNDLLFFVWTMGMLLMLMLILRARIHLYCIEKASLPVENETVKLLFEQCCRETQIRKEIPLYSTIFLKSPAILGIINPKIYLPMHLISDFYAEETSRQTPSPECHARQISPLQAASSERHAQQISIQQAASPQCHVRQMRFMLLHELQHYKRRDTLANYFINLAGIVYWFNPLVWYTLKEMRNDREIACDAAVLQLLNQKEYTDYGNTLIRFAEKMSLCPFPFTAEIGGSFRQIKRRIIHIASYQPDSRRKKYCGIFIYILIAVFLAGCAPALSTSAVSQEYYHLDTSDEQVTYIDLASYFDGYEGSFVLYNPNTESWQIYNEELASLRVSPDSTYKIYDALFALESGIIAPEQSHMAWDGEFWPFDAWNTDQDLTSAMQNSVNWYFQNLDVRNGSASLQNYLQKIAYGNEDMRGELSSYWMESSLKISPIEQVQLLSKLYDNEWGFAQENINAVKTSLRLFTLPSASGEQTIYGKTGTGQVEGQDINGWFVGFMEEADDTYFFAVNIQGEQHADGKTAAEIAFSILGI